MLSAYRAVAGNRNLVRLFIGRLTLALLDLGPEISARMLDRYRASAAPPT